ncbi:Negative regulator of mitotic exit [Podila epigama]|nr:Negative regulator of mitotic exit [Podila epigama]
MLVTPLLCWTQRRILGTNPFPRFMHTSSITATGTDIFLYGGNQRGTPKGDLFIIDSVSLQCQAVAPAGQDHPPPKSGHSAVNVGQYIIYFGGWDSVTGQCDDNLYVLHTARREWNRPLIQGALPTPRHSHIACAIGTTMFVFGGQVDNFYLDDIVAFDMKTITQNPRWQKVEPQTESPPARAGHCAGVYEGKIYIFGGVDADYFYNDIWCFDPRAATWTPIPASGYLPTGRYGHSCTVTDGTMYIFGGNGPDSAELNDAYAFKFLERRWYLFQNVGPVASPRSGHTMCTIKDRIFVLGGESEHTKTEDSALIYYLELSNIRFSDSVPQAIPPRQASSVNMISSGSAERQSLTDSSSSGGTHGPGSFGMGRNSSQQQQQQQQQWPGQGQGQGPAQGHGNIAGSRPDRPDRRNTHRPGSPATYTHGDRQALANTTSPQLMHRPLTTLGTPPPRGASAGQGLGLAERSHSQVEGLTIATRRQTMKDDFQSGYGGAVMGQNHHPGMNYSGSPTDQRRTMHQIPSPPPSADVNPSPLRVINVTPDSSPLSTKYTLKSGEGSPTVSRVDTLRSNDGLPFDKHSAHDDPYATEATMLPPSSGNQALSYIPPPPASVSPAISAIAAPAVPPPLVPPLSASLPTHPSESTSSSLNSDNMTLPPGAETRRGTETPPTLPPPPPPTNQQSGSLTPTQTHAPLLPSPMDASTPIPGPLDRSGSPASLQGAYNRPPPPPPSSSSSPARHSPLSPSASSSSAAAPHAQSNLSDLRKIKNLESMAEAVQDENQHLRQEAKEREQELQAMKRRENWLVTEVMLARSGSTSTSTSSTTTRERLMNGQGHMDSHSNNGKDDTSHSDFDIEQLEQELGAADLHHLDADAPQVKITRALLKVREELKNAKASIATQAHVASLKIKEAERVRTGALQEAAYLKAKLLSLSNVQENPEALVQVEMNRATDLEKRLTTALHDLETLEAQHSQALESLEQERHARLEAEDRSTASAALAQEAQAAHTRAHAELASLHTRVTKAESESRDYAAQLAESQAGFSGHQSQSSGLLQKVSQLKEEIEQQQTALEQTQKAYSIANDRAKRAETRADEASQKLEKLESERLDLCGQVNRFRGESERLQAKVEELEGRHKASKDEVQILRKLVEEGMASITMRAGPGGAGNKHDSIAILNTVSRVSELEHELSLLKTLQSQAHLNASRSANELADAMMEISRLEQASMQARSEVLSLQKLLSQEREGGAQLRASLSKAEQDFEAKVKEVEDQEVQLGLLKNVMREKGLLAEDMLERARFRGSNEYMTQLEERLREAEQKVQEQEQEHQRTREHFEEQLEGLESKRQATIQHSEKVGLLLRKLKNDLETTMKEKDTVETELKTLHEAHSRCANYAHELAILRTSQKEQEDERVEMLQAHFEEERKELVAEGSKLQSRLMDSEMLSTELSQKIISLTSRIEEFENTNDSLSGELETVQGQVNEVKANAQRQEQHLKADVERLVEEIHQIQKDMQLKQRELDEAKELNKQLEQQLNHALQAQTSAVTQTPNLELEHQRKELEEKLAQVHKAKEELQNENDELRVRLSDSEKKVALLLDNMQSNFSNPNSPLNSANLAGVHQQLTNVAAATAALTSGSSIMNKRGSTASITSVTSAANGAATLGHRAVSNLRLSSLSPLSPGNVARGPSSSPNAHRGGTSSRLDSSEAQGLSSKAPSGLQINKGSSNTPSNVSYDYDIEDDSSSDDRDVHEEEYLRYHQQHFDADAAQSRDGNVQAATSHTGASNRDSVDSITRELEMLRVPWNKSALNTNKNGSFTTNVKQPQPESLPQHQEQQQRENDKESVQQSAYRYSNNFYNIGGEDADEDNIANYHDTFTSNNKSNVNKSHLYSDDVESDDDLHQYQYQYEYNDHLYGNQQYDHQYHQYQHHQEEKQGAEEVGLENDFLSRLRQSSPTKQPAAGSLPKSLSTPKGYPHD